MSLEEMIAAANGGDIQAIYDIGGHYLKENDYQKALEWYSKGTEVGDVLCAMQGGNLCNAIASSYENSMKFGDALDWWNRALKFANQVAGKQDLDDEMKGIILTISNETLYKISAVGILSQNYKEAYETANILNVTEPRKDLLLSLCAGKVEDDLSDAETIEAYQKGFDLFTKGFFGNDEKYATREGIGATGKLEQYIFAMATCSAVGMLIAGIVGNPDKNPELGQSLLSAAYGALTSEEAKSVISDFTS